MKNRDKWIPESGSEYAKYLKELNAQRQKQKTEEKATKRKRQSLLAKERSEILAKTEGRCHICGGKVQESWEADHVMSYSKGGEHSVANYLPACRTCNNYRWDYRPDEFQEILRVGVWVRTQMEKETALGKEVSAGFVKHETRRIKRRK